MSDAIKKLLHTMNRLYIVSAEGGDKRGDTGVLMRAVMSGDFLLSSLTHHRNHHPSCITPVISSPHPTPKGDAGVVLRMVMWSVMNDLIKNRKRF